MDYESLQEALEDLFGVGSFSIDVDKKGQIVIYTGLCEDETGELVAIEGDEDEEDIDPDFEPLADEDDDF